MRKALIYVLSSVETFSAIQNSKEVSSGFSSTRPLAHDVKNSVPNNRKMRNALTKLFIMILPNNSFRREKGAGPGPRFDVPVFRHRPLRFYWKFT